MSSYHNEISQNPVVYRCIKLIAQNIASIPIVFDGEVPDKVKMVLQRPNYNEDFGQMMERMVSSLLVDGNTYLLLTGHDEEEFLVYTIDPKYVTSLTNESGAISGYSYTTAKGKRVELIDHGGRSKILHIKYLNPFGSEQSPCQVVAESVRLYNSITKHNQALMNNAARFSGALIVNGHMTDNQKQSLREEVDAKIGYRNAGHVAILQGDIRWEEMKANVRDADYTSGQTFVAKEIMQVFGVPPTMLGIHETGFNHYKEARLHFWEDTLLPLARYILAALQKWLSCWAEQDLNLRLDLHDIPALADKIDRRISSIAEISFLSDEQKRRICNL